MLFISIKCIGGARQASKLVKAMCLTEADIEHLFSVFLSSNALSGSAQSNIEDTTFHSSDEHTDIDKGTDIYFAIMAENGTIMVFTYHWSLWTCTTVLDFQSNSRNGMV